MKNSKTSTQAVEVVDTLELKYLNDPKIKSEIDGEASYEARSALAPPKSKKILVVEDDINHFGILEELIKEINPKAVVDWEVGMSGAIEKINATRVDPWKNKSYDLVISDVFLEDGDSGIDLLEHCNGLTPKVNCILNDIFTYKTKNNIRI